MPKTLTDWKITRSDGVFSIFENATEKIVVHDNAVMVSIFKSQSLCANPDDVVLKAQECTFVICPRNKEIRVYTNKE